MQFRAVMLLVVLAICVQCLPVEPNFRQTSLQAQETQTSAEIQSISARITFLQKLNKLTYDTTLFTRKLRWLLRRSLTEKPTVGEVADLMNKELEISKAQIDVAVEGVADELKLEVKQGIIALKAGLAFIQDNYKAGSDPQADAIIAKIKANLASLEARFGKNSGAAAAATGGASPTGGVAPTGGASPQISTVESTPTPTQSTAPAVVTPPVVQSTAVPPPVAQSTTVPPPVAPSTAGAPAAGSTGGSLIGSQPVSESTAQAAPVAATGPVTPQANTAVPSATAVPSTTATATPSTTAAAVPSVTASVTGHFNSTNGTSSTGEGAAAVSSLSSSAGFF